MSAGEGATNHAAYRADIDGLRAIAVLAVVAFHVGISPFSGGFVGVDIFFVISGYLITQILLRDLVAGGRIRMAEFYARRVRRLFPALAVVVLVTLVAGSIFLLPVEEQPDLASSTYAAAAYISNVHFERAADDYFAGPAEEQPLLHLWSLAVEEQFYLLWPALMFGLWWLASRFKMRQRRALLGAVGLMTLGSFALSAVLTPLVPGFAFYLLPTRAWELGVGALLAIGLAGNTMKAPRLGNILTATGLLALLGAVTLIDETMPFPGAIAAIPVIGSALCIAGGAFGSDLGNRLLGNKPMVWVGHLSYSLYLWHWPMLSIARAGTVGERNMTRDVLLALGAVLLAWLTLHWVENPIRYQRPGLFARRGTTLLAGAGISVVIALAGFALARGATIQAQSPEYAELLAVGNEIPLLPEGCQRRDFLDRSECTAPGNDPTREFVVWGDSHAMRAIEAVAAVASPEGIPVVQRTFPSCPPLIGVTQASRGGRPNDGCTDFNEMVFAELEEAAGEGKQIVAVLAARWPHYLGNNPPSGLPALTLSDTTGTQSDADLVTLLEEGLERTIAKLDAIGIRSVVVAPPPEFTHSPPKCRVRLSDEDCGIARLEAEAYTSPATDAIVRVAARNPSEVTVVDMFDTFCDLETCLPVKNGSLVYSDEDHLTYSAAAELAPAFADALGWALE